MFKYISVILLSLSLFACASTEIRDKAYPTAIVHSTEQTEQIQQSIKIASKNDIETSLGLVFDKAEWTRQEKIAFTLSTLAHLADLGSSLASDERCEESTPLLGKNPSNGALIGVKVLAIGFEYWLYNNPRFGSGTHFYGYTAALFHGITAYQNSRNDCYD
jgi:hypothetical protein